MSSPGASKKILVIDDEPTVLAVFEAVIVHAGHAFAGAADGREGLARFRDFVPDVVFSDLLMPDMDGLSFLAQAREVDADVPVVLMTAFSDKGKLMRAVQLGAFDFIEKPFDVEAIQIALDRALRQRALLLRRRRSELHTARIERLARRLNTSPSLEQLFAAVREETGAALGVRGFAVFVYEAESDSLRLRASSDAGADELVLPRTQATGPMHEALATRAPVIATEHGAAASIPLVVRDDLVGVMNLTEKSGEGAFDDLDLSFMAVAAEHIASAIAVRRKAEQLEAALAELHRTQRSLVQTEKLAAVTKLVAGIAHELKNPLTSLHFAVVNLQDELQRYKERGLDVTRGRLFLDGVSRDIARVREKVDTFMMFARPERAQRRACDPLDVVRGVLVQVAPRLEAAHVHVDVLHEPSLPKVVVDADAFMQAVMNLVVNAIEAVAEEGRIEVLLAAREGRLLVQVTDDGPGVPPEAAPHLFDLFFTTKAKGSGIGLSQVHVFCDTHGGKVWLDASSRRTCFSMSLPLPESS